MSSEAPTPDKSDATHPVAIRWGSSEEAAPQPTATPTPTPQADTPPRQEASNPEPPLMPRELVDARALLPILREQEEMMMNLYRLFSPPNVAARSAWEYLEQVFQRHYHDPAFKAARVLYASIAAHHLPGPLVWPMIVGPAGSMKTELLNALAVLPNVHFIDNLTPKTLISGQMKEDGKKKGDGKSSSLLHRIGPDGIGVCADFSTIMAKQPNEKAAILADLRRIYDGELVKHFGTDEDPEGHRWKGRLTFAVGVTPAIDRELSIFQSLGERFVMVRIPRAEGINAALTAMRQDREEVKREVQDAVRALLTGVGSGLEPVLSPQMEVRIASLSEIAALARTHVAKDSYKGIQYDPDPESNTRIAQQLAQLAKGSARLDGRVVVEEEDFQLVKEVAFDSMAPLRRAVLETVIRGGSLTEIPKAASTVQYAKDDCEVVGLIVNDSRGRPHLSDYAAEMLERAGIGGEA